VAILGPPNAGKSSLLNLLSRRDAAIVSPIEGTTRDVVTVSLQLGGLPVILSDTAGLRSGSTDPIERLGMVRSAAEAAKAQIQLWVYDAAAEVPPVLDAAAAVAEAAEHATGGEGGGLDSGDLSGDVSRDVSMSGLASGAAAAAYADAVASAGGASPPLQLLLLNKIDLVGGDGAAELVSAVPAEQQWRVSCSTGEGIAPFLDDLGKRVRRLYGACQPGYAKGQGRERQTRATHHGAPREGKGEGKIGWGVVAGGAD
jgi:tRNA modification GTPase